MSDCTPQHRARNTIRAIVLAAGLAAASSASFAQSGGDCNGNGVPDASELAAAQKFALCMDPRVVDSCAKAMCGCEPGNIRALLDSLGGAGAVTELSSLDAASIVALLGSGSTLVIPEQEIGAVVDHLGADLLLVRQAIQAGGRVLVFGDGGDSDARLLNALISGSESLPLVGSSGSSFARAISVAPEFAATAPTLSVVDGTFPLGGWAAGEVIYGSSFAAAAAVRAVGAGAVGFIAHDFSCPDESAEFLAWSGVAKAVAQSLRAPSERDCDSNGTLDSCEIALGAADCDGNGRLDSCELIVGAGADLDNDGTLDACEDDDGDGVSNALDRCPSLAGSAGCSGCPTEVCDAQERDIWTPRGDLACYGATVAGAVSTLQLPSAQGSVRITAHADANVGDADTEFVRVEVEGYVLPDIHDPGSVLCGWRSSADLVLTASEFNAILADGVVNFSAQTGSQTDCYCSNLYSVEFRYLSVGQPSQGSDADGDGVAIEADLCPTVAGVDCADGCPRNICGGCANTGVFDNDQDGITDCVDNCALVANADQANCDTDSLGNACDLDDDDDARLDLNDAYPCTAGKVDIDRLLSADAINAFLATSTDATIDGTLMSQQQLCTIGDHPTGIAPNGIGGAFTITRLVEVHQIHTILVKAQIGSGFIGGAIIAIDADNMSSAQLAEVAASIACVSSVQNLTVDAGFTAAQIAALVSKSDESIATIIATGMDSAKLSAGLSGSGTVVVRGVVRVDAQLSAAEITELASALASTGVELQFNTSGMNAGQIAAVYAALEAIAQANGGSNPYCDLVDGDEDGFFADACVESAVDCDDAARLYADVDADGFGGGAALACGVAQTGDICPNDPLKLTPGYCGCGSPETDLDGDGTPDCAEGLVAVTLAPVAPLTVGEEYVVRVRSSSAVAPGQAFVGIQLAMYFDTDWLHFVRVEQLRPGFLPIAEQCDNAAGTLRYAAGLAGEGGAAFSDDTEILDLVFLVKQPLACGRASLIGFKPLGNFRTALATSNGSGLMPVAVDLDNLDLDTIAPVITGIPGQGSEMPVDIGVGDGALMAAPAIVTAEDLCTGTVDVVLDVFYPGQQTAQHAWPSDSIFPIGVTNLQWTATDASGNVTTIARQVLVGDYQLVDITATLGGSILSNTRRQLRLSGTGEGSPWEQLVEATFPPSVGTSPSRAVLEGVRIPPRVAQDCISAKGILHTLSDYETPLPVGRGRYSVSYALIQGDSDDNNAIDVFDFSIYVGDVSTFDSPDCSPDGRSNFNGDIRVNSGDCSFICLGFFREGESCVVGADGGAVCTRVSLKELRRRGLGHLAGADLNGDGWIDVRDVQAYLQSGGNAVSAEAAQSIAEQPRT